MKATFEISPVRVRVSVTVTVRVRVRNRDIIRDRVKSK